MRRCQPYAQPALVLGLLTLLLMAGCRHTPATESRPITKDDHSQQPAVAAAPLEAPAPVPVLSERPRFAVQIAAFNQRPEAEALASRLSDHYGLQTLVAPVEVGSETLYRVRLLVQDMDQAESLANSFLRNQNMKVWIVALP